MERWSIIKRLLDAAAADAAVAAEGSTDSAANPPGPAERSAASCRPSTLVAQPRAADSTFAAVAAAAAIAAADTLPSVPTSTGRSPSVRGQVPNLVPRPSQCSHHDAFSTVKSSYSNTRRYRSAAAAGEIETIGGVSENIGGVSGAIGARAGGITSLFSGVGGSFIGGMVGGPAGAVVGAAIAGLVGDPVADKTLRLKSPRTRRRQSSAKRDLFKDHSGLTGTSSSNVGAIGKHHVVSPGTIGASSGGIISQASDMAIPYTSRPDESDFSPDEDRSDSGPESSATVDLAAECPLSLGPAPTEFQAPESQALALGPQPPARPPSPVGTRARFTYGLDRFDKNAMLIFAQSSAQGHHYVEKRVDLLARSFSQFRFEVTAHIDLGPEEMEACLENFFSRDWAGVGAVCVAVVGGAAEAGFLPARAQRLHESHVLRWLTDRLPPALAGRPRIYITEVDRSGVAADSHVYSLPITRSFPDVIGVHIPVIIEGEPNPLQMLCSRLGSERDFFAEVTAAAHAAETTLPALTHRPIQVENTLVLDLELVKTKESTASAQSETAPNGANNTPEIVPDGVNNTLEDLTDIAYIKLQSTQPSTSGISEVPES